MAHSETATAGSNEPGWQTLVTDWSADKQTFQVPWGKAMMWIFLLSDTFIFSCFLTGYMNVRMSTTETWPDPSHVFALQVGGVDVPLLLPVPPVEREGGILQDLTQRGLDLLRRGQVGDDLDDPPDRVEP
jgi:hypothetical protein